MKNYIKQLIKEEVISFILEEENKDAITAKIKKPSISYTALVLFGAEHEKLVSFFEDKIPEGWDINAHHATINLGGFKGDQELLNKEYDLIVDGYSLDGYVLAAKVLMPENVPSKENPHITIAVNRQAGGKPAMSNKLNWNEVQPIGPISLKTKLVEVPNGNNDFAESF